MTDSTPGSSITTRQGDRGTTRLFSGEEVSKSSLRTDAYGDIDELVSLLGIARAAATRPGLADTLREIQNELFTVASELATAHDQVHLLRRRIDADAVARLDRIRDDAEAAIVMPKTFILPGGTLAGAHIDHARAVSRRCERKAVHLHDEGLISNPDLLVWMNRLSDTLWLLARKEEGDAVCERT